MNITGKINAIGVKVTGSDGKEYVGKGTYSVYGLGRFPVSLYANQWRELMTRGPAILAEIEKGLAAGTLVGDKAATTLATGNRVALAAYTAPRK